LLLLACRCVERTEPFVKLSLITLQVISRAKTHFVLGYVWVYLRVSSFQIGLCNLSISTVPWTRDVQH
jgi:hypothetical protein